MRTPTVRVVLVALAGTAAVVGGALATGGGPIGGNGKASTVPATAALPAPAAVSTSSPVVLGTVDDQIARLPEVRPGQLTGTFILLRDGCSFVTLQLRTFVRTSTPRGVCIVPGRKLGYRLDSADTGPDTTVVDRTGAAKRIVRKPAGWAEWGTTADGVAYCKGHAGMISGFDGTTRVLVSCPEWEDVYGRLILVARNRRRLTDQFGTRLLELSAPLPDSVTPGFLGHGLLAIGGTLYRNGHQVAAYPEPDGVVISATGDGRVALVGRAAELGSGPPRGWHLAVYRDGVRHALDETLTSHGGIVAPDGSRLLLERDAGPPFIVLDVATLRPLARATFADGLDPVEWRASPAG